MKGKFVPRGFDVPVSFIGPGFRLEPLGPEHNSRDHEAWMSSIDHIHATPGMTWEGWPAPMTLEENLADLETHSREFKDRTAFTYSVLDGDDVIGCVYIYPGRHGAHDAHVRSWVRVTRTEMDGVVWRAVSDWLAGVWPFKSVLYEPRAEVDDYLLGAPFPHRATLVGLRATLRRILPDATESLSYGMPVFRIQGKAVAGYAYFKNHCSYFPHSGSVLSEAADDLVAFDWSKGTLKFPADEAPPDAIVRRLVEIRLSQLGLASAGAG